MDLSDQSAAAYIHDQLLETETLVFSSKQGLRDHFFGEEQVKQVPGQVLGKYNLETVAFRDLFK